MANVDIYESGAVMDEIKEGEKGKEEEIKELIKTNEIPKFVVDCSGSMSPCRYY